MPSSARPPSSCTPVSDAHACGAVGISPLPLPAGRGAGACSLRVFWEEHVGGFPVSQVRARQWPSASATNVVRGPRCSRAAPGRRTSSYRRAARTPDAERGRTGPGNKVTANLGVVGQEALPDRSSIGASGVGTQDSRPERVGFEREQSFNYTSGQEPRRRRCILLVPVLLPVGRHATDTPFPATCHLNVLWALLDLSQ